MRFLRKPLESFDMARVRLGGDCEDLAREILLEARELQQLVGVSGAVREMQLLAKRFVFAMILGGVSSPEINGEYASLLSSLLLSSASSYFSFQLWPEQGDGCPHVRKQNMCESVSPIGRWAMMVPRTLWRYWWSRGNGPSAPLPEHDAVPLVLEGMCTVHVRVCTQCFLQVRASCIQNR